jgi:hypothetical protein
VADADPFSDRKVPVSTRKIRAIRQLAEKASRLIHSNAAIHREDKKMVLGVLAQAKKQLNSILQLEMFSPDQLE